MRILWLSTKNFKCYNNIRVPAQGILPEGLLFVEGENSTGKSSLFDAIFYAFFYDPTTTKEIGTNDDLIRRGYSETNVEVAFELDDKCYIVRRTHSKKTAVQAFLMRIDSKEAMAGNTSGIQTLCTGVPDVEEKLTNLLNINKEKVLNTIIVRQGSVQALAEAKGAELRNVIYELFQLDYYRDKALSLIKDKKNNFENQKLKHIIQRTTENILQEIEEKKENIEEAKKDILGFDEKIEILQIDASQFPEIKEIQKINVLTDRTKQLDSIINKKQQNISETGEKFSLKIPIELKTIESKSNEFEKQIKDNEIKQNEIQEEVEKLEEERRVINIDLGNFNKRKKSLETIAEKGGQPKCDVCEQDIQEEKFNELLERSKRSIPALTKGIKKKEDLIKAKKTEIKDIDQSIFKIRQNSVKLEELIEDLGELKGFTSDKDKLSSKITESLKSYAVKSLEEMAKKYGLSNFEELFDHVKTIDDDINRSTVQKKHIKESIDKDHSTIDKLSNQIKENKEKEEKTAQIDLEIALLNEVQTYVEKFIVEDLISNRMLANIQHSTRGYIYLFTRGRYSELYLEPTKTKTLNMSIKDEVLGFVKSQTLLSGGDKAAIGLGLRIGISELLKRIRPLKASPYQPPKMDILVLDEPLGSLDDARRAKVIEGLVAEEKFSQIFLITHTNIRKRFKAPIITIQSNPSGSLASFYAAPTEIEEEAEEE